ncbi:hypothetical protein EAH72_34515 [Pseudomonas caspiana]|nr:hypothetical protein [Pseudomonas caspiana]TPG86725.1 hypothetical protein EAH72_34515 [Pseudomonas caspiana]
MNDKDPIACAAAAAAKSHPPLMQVATQDLAVLKRQEKPRSMLGLRYVFGAAGGFPARMNTEGFAQVQSWS